MKLMKSKTIFMGVMLIVFLFQGVSVAATGDVIDDFLYYSRACSGYANAVWADVDGIDNGPPYGIYDTMVVFTTITGEAYPVNEFTPPGKWYYFTPIDTGCGGTEPWERARLTIHFVDMLAPGFEQTVPNTWTYIGINSVSVKASHDLCVAPDIPWNDAYQSVLAYRERFQNGIITGTETPVGGWT